MANEQQWTKARHEKARELSEDIARRYAEALKADKGDLVLDVECYSAALETPDMLAEIERAWGEVEAANERTIRAMERESLAIETGRARLLHAHDAASALYRAASSAVQWWNLEPPARFNIDGHASMRTLRAAIDPALSTAVLAETQRRDGLDAECKRLNTTLTNIWNTLATALNELDINPVLDPEACAQQAAGVIVGTLSRPTLTAKQAREMAVALTAEARRAIPAWAQLDDTDSGLVAAVEAVIEAELAALLMRVAAPETAEQASVARAFDAAEQTDPQTSAALSALAAAGFGSMQLLHATPPPEMATTTGAVWVDEPGAACPDCREDCMGWIVDGARCGGVSQ